MSGIFGVMNMSASADINASLSRLCKWNNVFGETRETKVFSDSFGFGICADHITNAPVNRTPVLHRDKISAVIDALIYNRDEISGSFNIPLSYSDEEMLFELIIKHGPEKLKEVNGDFSGAVYYEEDNKLTLFTDHMGVHPIFIYKSSSMAAFSTEVRGLINLPEIPGEINPEYLYATLCGYINSNMTATEYSDIFVIRPATYLDITVSAGELKFDEQRYWTLGERKIRLFSEQKYISRMRELITESIRKRLAVFPDIVGAELSGGLDSGVIDILINRLGREGVYFSWFYDPKDDPLLEQDDRRIIQDICDQENITCNYRKLNYGESNSNIIKRHEELGFDNDGIGSLNFRFAYPLYTNTEIICEASQLVCSKGGKVVFSGHGGDEGVSHRCDPYELYFAGEKFHFAKWMWDSNKGAKKRLLKTYRDYKCKIERGEHYRNNPSISSSGAMASFLLKDEFKGKFKDYKGTPFYYPYDPLAYIGTGATNVRLNVAAMFGPYSGARYVFPFLDRDVIDFAVSIPRHLYLKNGQKRYIFRQAFKDIMPKSLYENTNKLILGADNSDEEEKDWFAEQKKTAEFIYDYLDREFWGEYLDFDAVQKLKDSERPETPEDQQKYISAVKMLGELAQFQNIVRKVKAID